MDTPLLPVTEQPVERVLVVHDSKGSAERIARDIRQRHPDWEVLAADSFAAALSVLEANPRISFVVTDNCLDTGNAVHLLQSHFWNELCAPEHPDGKTRRAHIKGAIISSGGAGFYKEVTNARLAAARNQTFEFTPEDMKAALKDEQGWRVGFPVERVPAETAFDLYDEVDRAVEKMAARYAARQARAAAWAALPVEIEPAKHDDVDAIQALFRAEARVARSWKKDPALGEFYPQSMHDYIDQQEKGCPRHQLLVARRDGQVIGFIQALHRLPGRGNFTVLHRWGVHGAHQGKGLGMALFEQVKARSHTLGRDFIEVHLPEGNPVALYEKLGFVKQREQPGLTETRRPQGVYRLPAAERAIAR